MKNVALMLLGSLGLAGPPPMGPPPPPHVMIGRFSAEVSLSEGDRAVLEHALVRIEALDRLQEEARVAHEALMAAERSWLDALNADLSDEGRQALRDALPPPPPPPPAGAR